MKFEIGKYKGKLLDAGVAVLDNEKQTPYMYLMFDILSHIQAGEEYDITEQATRDVKFFLSEKALPYAEKDLAKLGFNGDFEHPEFFEKLYTEGCELFCGENVNGDKVYEDWSIVGLGGQTEKKPAPKNLLKKLNAKWKAHGNNTYQEEPTKQTVTAGADQSSDDKFNPVDDIPF